MDEPTGQAHKDPAGLTADSPDTRGRIIAVKELKGGTRLICGTLLDDRLRESLVAVDEDLRSAVNSYVFLPCHYNGEHTASRSPRETRITSPYFLVH